MHLPLMCQSEEYIRTPILRFDIRTPIPKILRIHILSNPNHQIIEIPHRTVSVQSAVVNIADIHPVIVFVRTRIYVQKELIITGLLRVHVSLHLVHIRHLVRLSAPVGNSDIISVRE